MRAWILDHLASRPLDRHDVTRAHISAPHVLRDWDSDGSRHARGAFLSLMVGAVIPLLGCVVLGWTPGLVLLAVAVDVATLWLCDALKSLLARHRVEEERAHRNDADDVLAVILALKRPRYPMTRDLLAPATRRRFYVAPLPSHVDDPNDRTVMIGMGLFAFLLFGMLVAFIVPETVPWLLAGAALRIAVSVLRTLRVRRASGPQPDLLPDAAGPTLALIVVVFPGAYLLHRLGPYVEAIDAASTPLLLLALHLLVAVAMSLRGMHRLRRARAELRVFAASDVEALQARLRRVNGP